MDAAALASTILTFAAIVVIGVVLRATGLLRSEDSRPLNAVIIYVGLPAFIFSAVHDADLGPDIWRVVAVSWVAFLAVAALATFVTTVRHATPSRRGAVILASSFGNTGYIGYPITAALLGASAVPTAVFSDVFGTVFAFVLAGIPIAARLGSKGGTRVNLLRELLTFPAVIALAAGLALRPVAIPSAVSSGLDALASIVAPLIMLSVGLSLRPRSMARGVVDLALVVLLRLVLSPVIAFLAGDAMVTGEALRVAALQGGMPTMMLALVVGERFGLDTDFIASAIFVTTVLSAVTIPFVQTVAF